jgi:hypothetical protein
VALGKLKQRTAEDYGTLLNRYVLPELGAMALPTLTPYETQSISLHRAAALIERRHRQR